MNITLGLGKKLFISHLLAVFLVSGSVGTFFYFNAHETLMRSLRSRLRNSAALLSQSIAAEEMAAIRDEAGTALPAYTENLEKLRRLRRTNPDIAFLYVMRKEGETVRFVIDSDETEAQAKPGQAYDDVPPNMWRGFHSTAVDDKLESDDWGVFLSGYAPLAGGDGTYLVGIDMRADEVARQTMQLRLTGLVSLLASILLALLFARTLSSGLARRILALIERCREVSAGKYAAPIEARGRDEFDDLIRAFNTMSEQIAESRQQTGVALEELNQAKENLEERVRERTADLEKAVERVQVMRGLLPICSGCKKIRDDNGYWQQVEQFVEAYTDAKFSHGLCPQCATRLYGLIASDP